MEPLWRQSGGPSSVHLAGTGTWLPLARTLAAAFERREADIDVVVHESIGSRGGIRAVSEGAVDVGLTTWSRQRLEGWTCCRFREIATGAVVFATHPEVRTRAISREQVVEIFSGRSTRWGDGSVIVPLLREEGDSSTRAASRAIAGLGEAIDDGRRRRRWPVLLTDAEMGGALRSIPGAIGVYDLGAILLESPDVGVLDLDGVTPSPATIADGSYPLVQTLSLIHHPNPRPQAQRFLDFITSAECEELIRGVGGYLPARGGAPPR